MDIAAFKEKSTIDKGRAANDKSIVNNKGDDVVNQRFKLNEHGWAAMLTLPMSSNLHGSKRTMASGTGF